MRQVNLEAMEALLLRYKGRYTTVVRRGGGQGLVGGPYCCRRLAGQRRSLARPHCMGLRALLRPPPLPRNHPRLSLSPRPARKVGFCPTGWSQGRVAKGLSKRGRRSQHGTVVLYQVRAAQGGGGAWVMG